MKVPPRGLATRIGPLRAPRIQPQGEATEGNEIVPTGGSDDIGDISWNVPTVVLSYPSNIQGGPGPTGRTRFPWQHRSRTKAS
jgi:aminobenzoyl-glutamate utilization protein B